MGQKAAVDNYILNHLKYKEELLLLREILVTCGLEETIKWGTPVYTIEGKNVVGLAAFKAYTGLWFFQGVTLKDEHQKLVNAQENKTKAMRQWRFNSTREIDKNLVIAYIKEAIQNQKDGNIIKAIRSKPLIIPPELEAAFKENMVLRNAFETFSLSKKRDFTEYILNAKKIETKIARITKIIPLILEKRGLNDRYRK